MQVDTIASFAQQQVAVRISDQLAVSALKRDLNQQELVGEAALKLMDAAALPTSGKTGTIIDIYA